VIFPRYAGFLSRPLYDFRPNRWTTRSIRGLMRIRSRHQILRRCEEIIGLASASHFHRVRTLRFGALYWSSTGTSPMLDYLPQWCAQEGPNCPLDRHRRTFADALVHSTIAYSCTSRSTLTPSFFSMLQLILPPWSPQLGHCSERSLRGRVPEGIRCLDAGP
jgi:hypothetical protein